MIDSSNILAKTRAEEHAADVWGEFYIPPYYNKLALKSASKSTYIIGKRGCGKTMLLKYLDYHTAFSPKRPSIPNDEAQHIGIYWRVDTQFCTSMNRRGLEEADWITIFESYFSLIISVEIIKSLKVVAKSSYQKFNESDYDKIHLLSLQDFDPDYPTTPVPLEAYLEGKRRKFASWISNISQYERPSLPPGKMFLESLVSDVKQIAGLEEVNFYIYVDEVENLAPYQRKVLNTFLKHSQKPIIINLASKELSDETATTGSESINASHDFILRNLDVMLNDQERKAFYAEVVLANFDMAAGYKDTDFLKLLRDSSKLAYRESKDYLDDIFIRIKQIYPTKTYKELAADAVKESRIRNIIQERIAKALGFHNAGASSASFMAYADIAPEAIIVLPPLLFRKKNSPEYILDELQKFSSGQESKFKSSWIDNNLVGSLLELYRPYGAICPIYSGFDTFCTMASNNLRNFLILCYKAIEVCELVGDSGQKIPVEIQARATFEAADQLIKEISTFGELGERLRMFVLRLGHIFKTLQSSPAMSESEQNQFTINSGQRAQSGEENKFLHEAKKYAILAEAQETKSKSKLGNDIVDYQLNPIYSPYFQISFRRKRKIEISVEDFYTLALGTEDEYKSLLNRLSRNQNENGKTGKLPVQENLWL